MDKSSDSEKELASVEEQDSVGSIKIKKVPTDSLPEQKKIYKKIGEDEDTKILVTGGNGYLGSHIVACLLDKGVSVKVSVRDLSDEKRYSHLKELKGQERLEIVEGKLTDKECWANILEGCSAVIHTASPTPFKSPKQELEVIYPAVEGTLSILHAAVELGIRRVIMTSCYSAAKGGKYQISYDENCWGEPENVTSTDKSKIFAERAAWYFVKENEDKLDFTSICPGFLLGPCLQNHYDFASGLFFKKFMDFRVNSLLQLYIPFCDVRDAAIVHTHALWNPKSINQRYLCVQDCYTYKHLSGTIANQFKSKEVQQEDKSEAKFPVKEISSFPLKLMALFDSSVKTILPFYNKVIGFPHQKLEDDFNITAVKEEKQKKREQCNVTEAFNLPSKRGYQRIYPTVIFDSFRNFDETLLDMGMDFIAKKFIDRVMLNSESGGSKTDTESEYRLPDLSDKK